MPPKRATSPSSTPVPSTEGNAQETSNVTGPEWEAMQNVLNTIYDYRTPDGYDPSKVFHRKVNKRAIPAYYQVIKEPMAMSTVKQKINNREYKHFGQFVRDWALIAHNAQVYNRPDAGAYQDALLVRGLVEAELKKLVHLGLITDDVATLPYLGEIPPPDEFSPEEDEDEDDEEDDEDEGEEVEGEGEGEGEGDDSDEEGGKRKRRRGRPSKRDQAEKADDPETRKKRGRPPKVLTPTEARIHAILKGIRKAKNAGGQVKMSSFERLPDKAAMPEYYSEISEPMAFDVLKRKLKRKKYHTLEQFMKDVDVMFNNAQSYNQDESQIYKDAVELQTEAHRLADEQEARPDSDFVMDEGRIPMPNGILHNGELYKVGDWVHVQNANDLTKPIPCQIYRTWQDAEGGQWVNVCWYYRPEQTVHRFDKHFLENEVVKTGQYRDHGIDEIVDRCFIMFLTRYYKGRPRGLPPDMEVYVCEARYNEEKFRFNKIKTWASCLPDEVRDKDYEMDLFDVPRKMKKMASPIAYLLRDDANETDETPKPEWGAEKAPPKIGAVHKRPRDPKDSPPPEPTPEPPPPQPVQAPLSRQPSHIMSPANVAAPVHFSPMRPQMHMSAPTPARPLPISRPSYTPVPQQYPQHSLSPAPTLSRALSGHSQPFAPHTPQQPSAVPLPRTATHPSTYHAPPPPIPPPPSAQHTSQSRPSSYRDPAPIEVYTLPDAANASIPPEIRHQFHCDEQGRVLFFTAPPLQLAETEKDTTNSLGHSVHYLATKSRREHHLSLKRKAFQEAKAENQAAKKKARIEQQKQAQESMQELKLHAIDRLESTLAHSIEAEMKAAYGEDAWQMGLDTALSTLAKEQELANHRNKTLAHNQQFQVNDHVSLRSAGILFDDVVD